MGNIEMIEDPGIEPERRQMGSIHQASDVFLWTNQMHDFASSVQVLS